MLEAKLREGVGKYILSMPDRLAHLNGIFTQK